MNGNDWDKMILGVAEENSRVITQKNEQAKIRLNEKYFVYPEFAKEKFCPKIKENCKGVKCMFWIKGKKEESEIRITVQADNQEYIKTWNGLIGGDELSIKRITTERGWKEKTRFEDELKKKKSKIKGKYFITALWVKESSMYKGICLYKFSLIRTVFNDK